MADTQFIMTKQNYDDLKKELDFLVKVKRPEIIERIAVIKTTYFRIPYPPNLSFVIELICLFFINIRNIFFY